MSESTHLSIPELAKMLGISRIALYKKVKKGQVKAVKIGRNYAIERKYITQNIIDLLKDTAEEPSLETEVTDVIDQAYKQYKDTFHKLGKY